MNKITHPKIRMIDYKALLIKYVRHVQGKDVNFLNDEREELKQIIKQIKKEN